MIYAKGIKMSDENREKPSRNRIRFDDTLSVAHILTTIGMIMALFNWGSTVNSTLAVQSSEISHIKESRAQNRAELTIALAEINRKLDDLAEK